LNEHGAPSAAAVITRRGGPRVIIAHDNLWWYGGAERIIATAAAALPEAPIWTVLGRREVAQRMGVDGRVHALLPEWEPLLRGYRALAPLYPPLIRVRRLPEADVLLTSSFAFAHHFSTRNHAPQLCYCYSPLRMAWSMTDAYGDEVGGGALGHRALRALAAWLRAIDRRAARRVTRYVAESKFVADQIERFYGRSAAVIYPPVDCELFRPSGRDNDGYFLFCGRLVEAYKRPSIVVDAFRGLPHRLVIAGTGPALEELKRRAGPNVEFVGQLGDSDLVPLMQGCAAVIFPSRDDFGLIPVEVMACGRPVIAYGAGGALETIVPGRTGEFFSEQTADAVSTAVRNFDPDAYDPRDIRSHAEQWREERFVSEMLDAVSETAAGAGDA
jgi:glycosyltransferase involved in cell wall biosynthesis